jgi:hypothetical protein
MPDVPALNELGYKFADVDLQFWWGLFVPKGTPEPIRAKLEKALQTTMANPVVRERLLKVDTDPSFAPGTGTPEIGGLSVQQGLEIIRGLRGLNLVGADIVEISPPYDPQGTTALVGANLAYEMLCVMPGVAYRA